MVVSPILLLFFFFNFLSYWQLICLLQVVFVEAGER